MDNKIIIKDSFTMPAVDDTINVIVSKSIGLTPECWIWNDSVGYLKVVKFSLYDNQVTLENVGRIENAKAGTLFPTCMEFLITAPAPIDLYNSMSTCLKADFNSPSVGNEALMSVESSYAISVDDQVIIDRTYRYLVTQVVNSTTLKVKNEGLGATGIIHVDCNECTPVQVVNQLNCCPIPTGDLTSNTSVLEVTDGDEVLLAPASITLDTDLSKYDNSSSEFITLNDVPRGTLSSNSSLVSVTNGTNNVLDNISLDLDTDLSKYNNTTSGYITLGDVPRGTLSSDSNLITVTDGTNNVLDNISLDLDTDLSKYDNSSSEFLAFSDKKNLTSNTTVLTVTNGTGTTLENTSLTLDTDLSQYDNSSSNFLATSDKKDLTSTTPILTVTNGTGATLENTIVSLNTDLSQYDNSVSKFVSVGGLPSGDITSANSILTVAGGTGATLTNTLLTIDDDLSHYDNTTSAFITLGDIPALPSDTDLSHYDNSTSGFITSSSLPTVNDAKLTIYQSDGVTPFVEFTANASSAVTATLPSSGGSLVYFEESYDIALTTARFVPNTNSGATSYSLGNTNNWINDSYIENTRVKTLIGQNYVDGITYPSSNSAGHTVIYDAGTSSSNNGRHEFRTGGFTVLTISENGETVATGDIVPDSDNSVWLGRAGKFFAQGCINNINTQDIFPTPGNTSINIGGNLLPGSATENLGSNINKWSDAYISNLYADNLEFNTTYADFNFTPITGGINIASGKTITTPPITISNPYTHGNMILFIVVTCNISRLRGVSNSGTINHAGPRFQGYMNRTTDSAQWYLLDYYTEYQLTTNYEDRSYSLTYTLATTIPPSTTYSYNASIDITTVGYTNGTLTVPGGTAQRGKMEILYGHIN